MGLRLALHQLCVDASRKSWKRVDAGKGTLIFNGTHLITLSESGRLKGKCTVAPTKGGDPLQAMPFTMIMVDQQASYNGSTQRDSVACDLWQHHRHTGEDAGADALWCVDEKRQVVQAALSVASSGQQMITR